MGAVPDAEQPTLDALRHRIEGYFDAAPRESAAVEAHGPFTIFVSHAPWPYYARPRLHRDGDGDDHRGISAADVRQVVRRQRELGVAICVEWQQDLVPELATAAVEAGLSVRLRPLLVHDRSVHVPLGLDSWNIDVLTAGEPEIERIRAVAAVGWRQVDTSVGPAGASARDDEPLDVAGADFSRAELADGRRSMAVVRSERDGAVAVGTHRPCGDVSEIVGVAVLPAFRRRGLATALTAVLVDDAYARGAETVMLTAESDAVARIYERGGFRRIGFTGEAVPAQQA